MLLVTSSLFTSYTVRSISRGGKGHIRDRDKKNNRTHGNMYVGGDIASSLPAFINSLNLGPGLCCGTWEEHELEALENKVLRETSGPERVK